MTSRPRTSPRSKPSPGSRPGPRPKSRYGAGRVSLERALSKLGVASRTRAREKIVAGQVRVDGRVVRDPAAAIDLARARIEIGGGAEAVRAAPQRTILLHKPKGVVTTASDEKGRPTVYSLLSDAGSPRLVPVGRLDLATTGALLLTSDTRLAAWLTDPANGVPRVYLVTVRGCLSAESAVRLERGVDDGGERLRADGVEIRKASGRETHLVIRLREGKNREIRRMLAGLGHEVTKLKRVSFGGIELGDLAAGSWRELSLEELRAAFPGAPLCVGGAKQD